MATLSELENRPGPRAFDLDDTVFWRERVTRYLGAQKGRRSTYTSGKYVLDEIPVMDHSPVDFRGVKNTSRYFHSRRQVIPGLPERIREHQGNGNPVFGISGRPATIEWSNMTLDQLFNFGIEVNKLVLTPLSIEKHISTTESKADAIRSLGVVEFSDDDGKTLLAISELFPDVLCNWVRHKLQNISERDQALLASRPNVRVIPISDWMRKKS